MTAQAQQSLTNWAGNYTYSSPLSTATSSGGARLVRSHDRLRVLGTRHCFNTIADGRDGFLSLGEMAIASRSTPGADGDGPGGMRYGRSAGLEEKGLALHNLASLPHISVAGACARGLTAPARRTATSRRRWRGWSS